MKRALAKEILIRHPPEKYLVGLTCISAVNPRPNKMRRALDSAEEAPMTESCS
jgi:hypothetical protein